MNKLLNSDDPKKIARLAALIATCILQSTPWLIPLHFIRHLKAILYCFSLLTALILLLVLLRPIPRKGSMELIKITKITSGLQTVWRLDRMTPWPGRSQTAKTGQARLTGRLAPFTIWSQTRCIPPKILRSSGRQRCPVHYIFQPFLEKSRPNSFFVKPTHSRSVIITFEITVSTNNG